MEVHTKLYAIISGKGPTNFADFLWP